jgi:aspartate--ammonia ligase
MITAILKTEEAIAMVKHTFATALSTEMELTKISSPLAVLQGTGINDDLNGTERTVRFPVKSLEDREAVVVNSLAKWKRVRLQELEVDLGKGILTDMRAIRPDEDYSPIHSIYVDQWDWEKHISPASRSIAFLKSEVKKIYRALRETEAQVATSYPEITAVLPEQITFIHTEDLVALYPHKSPKERESLITKQYGAVFLMGIGNVLSEGKAHDGRAPDYDDWSSANDEGYNGLNGDILVWHPVLKSSFELSSMGIRVDKPALLHQLKVAGATEREKLAFHQLLITESLPQSMGGGIGQSRVCMFMLRKQHIGEVQVGIWPVAIRKQCQQEGILLL